MGNSSEAKLLPGWPVSAEARGASDGMAHTKGSRGGQVFTHGWLPQGADAVDLC